MVHGTSSAVPRPPSTANDRFKSRFGDWFWRSLITATFLHFLAFAFWPQMTTADLSSGMDEIVTIDLPPDVPIPPPPEEVVRPANPIISDALIDDDITIPRVTYDEMRPEDLPAPRAAAGGDIAGGPTFVPRTVEPALRNRPAVERALERSYPPLLRDAGIGGTPTVWLLIDEDGHVIRSQIETSSGYEQLDRAALEVSRTMQFSPAMNRDRRVAVWVAIPIVFQAR